MKSKNLILSLMGFILGIFLLLLPSVTEAVCSALNYPIDKWQRVWYVSDDYGNFGVCYGDGPDEYGGDLANSFSGEQINFDNDWGLGKPGGYAYGSLGFTSSRTIYINPAGTYRFTLGSDDGSRLYIDGVSRINLYWEHGYQESSTDVSLTKGTHQFGIDYFEKGGSARVKFNYTIVGSGAYCTWYGPQWGGPDIAHYFCGTPVSGICGYNLVSGGSGDYTVCVIGQPCYLSNYTASGDNCGTSGTYDTVCKKFQCPTYSSKNGEYCRVERRDCSSFSYPIHSVISSGVWDAADFKCVQCNYTTKKESVVCGTTTGIYQTCDFSQRHNAPCTGSSDSQCESACGADTACDEKSDGTVLAQCTGTGQTYFADKCSSCVLVDDTSLCRSSTYASGCTADAACNGVAPGTGGCTSDCKVVPPENCCNGVDDDGDGKEDGYDPDCQTDKTLAAGSNTVCWWTEWDDYGNSRDYYSGWYTCPTNYIVTTVDISQYTEGSYDFFYMYDSGSVERYKDSGLDGTKTVDLTSYNTQKVRFRFTSDSSVVKDGVKVNTITCSGMPDLIISTNSYSPTSPVAGDSMTFTGTVKNQGGSQAVASQTRLRIDINNDGTYDVTPANQSTGALNAGATETETWSSAWTAQAGTHKYEICADTTAVVTESNETNNCVTQTFTVTAAQPDLIISTNSYSPTSPVAGDSMTFTGTVKNQGGSQAVASQTRLRIDINNDGTYDVTPANQSTGALNAGATETETWSSAWTAQAGTHKYEICADITGLVTESNETNNCVTQTFTVTTTPVFDFSISIDPASGSVTQGDAINATVNLGLISGTTQTVSLSASNLPPGASVAFYSDGTSSNNCSPPCSRRMTIFTTASTTPGNYPNIKITGTGGGQTHDAYYNLTVTEAGVAITPPSVTTNFATNIAMTSATLNGTLNNMGGATSCLVWFKWGPTTAMANSTPVQTTTSTGSFSANISGLTSNTTYYFEAFAKNGGSW